MGSMRLAAQSPSRIGNRTRRSTTASSGVEESELPVSEDGEERTEEVEEPGEIENVRPEEDAPGGARAKWETEEPLEGCCLCSAPEPPCVANLGGGGEADAHENDSGDQRDDEAVDGRDRAERDTAASTENKGEEEVEDGGGDYEFLAFSTLTRDRSIDRQIVRRSLYLEAFAICLSGDGYSRSDCNLMRSSILLAMSLQMAPHSLTLSGMPGQRPETAPPPEPNHFHQHGFGFMGGLGGLGGFAPTATARFGNFTLSAAFGGLIPSLFNLQVHGFPDAAMYGAAPGFPYGFNSFHGGHAHGYPHHTGSDKCSSPRVAFWGVAFTQHLQRADIVVVFVDKCSSPRVVFVLICVMKKSDAYISANWELIILINRCGFLIQSTRGLEVPYNCSMSPVWRSPTAKGTSLIVRYHIFAPTLMGPLLFVRDSRSTKGSPLAPFSRAKDEKILVMSKLDMQSGKKWTVSALPLLNVINLHSKVKTLCSYFLSFSWTLE
ncbi:hypothetical protein Q3G72_016903 [Acer saccharum]|nr:hypothetical protein Q3G72_016903 [Acer saccharum]